MLKVYHAQGLLHLSNDESSNVKMLVCQGLITLVEVRLEFVQQHLPLFVDCVLKMIKDEDESVALEATEFWPVLAETRMCDDILRKNLGRILPVLLDGMVYSECELADLEAEEEENENVPDKPQDIKPFIYNKGRGDDDDDYEPEEWSLRKCSAAALDIFASVFRDEILPIVLPIISQRLQDNNVEQWPYKESAILALGAIAEGCSSTIDQHLPQIIPFLFHQSMHPKVDFSPLAQFLSASSHLLITFTATHKKHNMLDLVSLRGMDSRSARSAKVYAANAAARPLATSRSQQARPGGSRLGLGQL